MAGDLLSRHAWTRADLAARLRRRGAPGEIATEVVDDLVSRGYVDDAAFARLRMELRARGVASPVIGAAPSVLSAAPMTGEATPRARSSMRSRAAP